MIDGIFCEAVAAYLAPLFPGVFVGVPQNNERITMPAIVLELRADNIVGSPLQRGQLIVGVASQADDTDPHDHAQFALTVSDAMRGLTISSSVVALHGIVSASSDSAHGERHWQTNLTYTVGFSPL
jgi:hypothetical protein